MQVTGDGNLASAPFGRGGGRLTLGQSLPSLVIPSDAIGADGRVFTLRKAAAAQLEGTPLSVAFEVAPPTDARPEHAFVVLQPLDRLPDGCDATRTRLAIERPGDNPPGTPALTWIYVVANYAAAAVSAALSRIEGARLEFVCLPGGP